MKGSTIRYSTAEMQWLEANRMMVISDYHAAFVAAFGRTDVRAAHLHGLRKRKGWKVGRAPGRFAGRSIKYSAAEIAWLRANCTLKIGDYHRAFCAAFGRTDISAGNLNGLRKRRKWKTGRDGRFSRGVAPWSKGKKIGSTPGSARTQFKKGSRTGRATDLYKPIGFERVSGGYLVRKINDDLPMYKRWRAVHLLNWERDRGPIPDGFRLKCLDGNKLNVDIANWEIIPMGMLPRLNGKSGRDYDHAPAELRPAIMAVAKLEHRLREKVST